MKSVRIRLNLRSGFLAYLDHPAGQWFEPALSIHFSDEIFHDFSYPGALLSS